MNVLIAIFALIIGYIDATSLDDDVGRRINKRSLADGRLDCKWAHKAVKCDRCNNGRLVSVNGTCECKCFFSYSGICCDREPPCMKNTRCIHGTMRGDCTCQCHPGFKGSSCETAYCSYLEHNHCETNLDKCDYVEIKTLCHKLCRKCKNELYATCSSDAECSTSYYGCEFHGTQPTPEMCATLGVNGLDDHSVCVGHPSNRSVFCRECKYGHSRLALEHCPVRCGLCPGGPPLPMTTKARKTDSPVLNPVLTDAATDPSTSAESSTTSVKLLMGPNDDNVQVIGPVKSNSPLIYGILGAVVAVLLLIIIAFLFLQYRRRKSAAVNDQRQTVDDASSPPQNSIQNLDNLLRIRENNSSIDNICSYKKNSVETLEKDFPETADNPPATFTTASSIYVPFNEIITKEKSGPSSDDEAKYSTLDELRMCENVDNDWLSVANLNRPSLDRDIQNEIMYFGNETSFNNSKGARKKNKKRKRKESQTALVEESNETSSEVPNLYNPYVNIVADVEQMRRQISHDENAYNEIKECAESNS